MCNCNVSKNYTFVVLNKHKRVVALFVLTMQPSPEVLGVHPVDFKNMGSEQFSY
jgi:hypothetical protein